MKLFCNIMLNKATENPFLDIIIQNLFRAYLNNNMLFDSRTKFDSLETIRDNKYLSAETKNHFFLKFHYSQRLFWKLTQFFSKYIKNRKLQ
jgi:hypothetical protein